MSSQAGISTCRLVSSASGGMTPSAFWRAKVSSRSLSQPWWKEPTYLSAHSLGTWCGAWVAPGAEVYKERLVGHQRLLLANPVHRMIGEILGQMIALLGRRRGLDRGSPFVECGIPLVVLATDKAIEVLKAAAARRPVLKGPHGAAFPDRHFVTLAKHGGRIAVVASASGQPAPWCWAAASFGRAPQ